MPRPRRFLRLSWLLVLAFPVLAVGCNEEIIQTQRQPRQYVRLLAAMVPHGDAVWVVKMTGSADSIAENADEFHQFLRGLRFTSNEKEPLTWTLPQGWQTERSRERTRFATFRTSKNLEVAVSMVSGTMAGDKLANINRWRGQLGLAQMKDSELPSVSRTAEVAGEKDATIVDMTAAQGMPVDLPAPSKEVGKEPIEYKTPAGWSEGTKVMPEQFAVYNAGEVSVSINLYPGDGGGLVPNINRWRGQVKLPRLDADALKKELREIKVGDTAAQLLDATGPDQKRVVGIVCSRKGRTWFFKMIGPAAEVEAQRKAFDEMIQSVRFAAEE